MTLSDWGSIGSIVALIALSLSALRKVIDYMKVQRSELERAKTMFSSFGSDYEENAVNMKKRQDMSLYILMWHQRLTATDIKNRTASYWFLVATIAMAFMSRDTILHPNIQDVSGLIEIGLLIIFLLSVISWYVNVLKLKKILGAFEDSLMSSLENRIYREK
jgi:hypothetical protein